MSEDKTEDTGLTGGEENAEASTQTAEIDQSALANMFRTVPEVEDELEESEDSSEETEESATETEEDSMEEESSLTDETEEESEEEESEEEEDDEEPEWFKKRIDTLTRQRKEAEERVEALEKKLSESEKEGGTLSRLDEVQSIEELDDLWERATDTEDVIDGAIDEGPEVVYDDNGNERRIYKIGDKEFTHKELIGHRKRAREIMRKAPERKQFLQQKSDIEGKLKDVTFFAKEDDPYYKFAQNILNSKAYKAMSREIPDAKYFVALAVQGQMSIDAANNAKKQAPKKAAKKVVKPTPKAATDTGTVTPPETDSSRLRQKKKKLLSKGSVGKSEVADLFKL